MEQIWTAEAIEKELAQYKELESQTRLLRLDLDAYVYQIANAALKDAALEADALRRPVEGMPSGTSISDPTARLGISRPYNEHIKTLEAEIKRLTWRIERMDAWLNSVTHKQRMVLTWLYLDKMTWPEIAMKYNKDPSDGNERQIGTFKRWHDEGIDAIIALIDKSA